MQYSTFLKRQSIAFIDFYEIFFKKTIKQALLWTIACFAITAVIHTYNNYNPGINTQPISILSFFISRFSYRENYSQVDNVKSIFIFFVAVFSINLTGRISVKNIICLLGIMVTCALLDFSFFQLKEQLHHIINNKYIERWTSQIIFLLRIYVPLILFALTIQICTSGPKFTTRKIIFLIIALYFFNEVAYEIIVLVRASVFELLLAMFDSNSSRFVAESILGIGVIASFFLGYHCAMTEPFRDGNDEKI